MRIFGLGDLHLSLCRPLIPGEWDSLLQYKPMDIFGDHWHHHVEKIYHNWVDIIREDDVILVPGDISWSMTVQEAVYDLEFLGKLPGKIIIVRGNHDYWWASISRIRNSLPRNIEAIQNDSICIGDTAICGTRGWTCPGSPGFNEHDEKIFLREVQRLEFSLKSIPRQAKRVIVMMHFMPVNECHEPSDFTRLMERYGVELCVYGHLHQGAYHLKLPEVKWDIRYCLVSADYLNFIPKLLWEEKN